MEELHHYKDALLEKINNPILLKKTPSELRQIRNEIQDEFNKILRHIIEIKKKKKTKKKKIVAPRFYISDSSDGE
jgi:hypothetical protein